MLKKLILLLMILCPSLAMAETFPTAYPDGPKTLGDFILWEAYKDGGQTGAMAVYEIAPGWEQGNTVAVDFTGGDLIALTDGSADSSATMTEMIQYSTRVLVVEYTSTATSGDADRFEGPLYVQIVGSVSASWLAPISLGTWTLSSLPSIIPGAMDHKAWAIDFSNLPNMPYIGIRVYNNGGETLNGLSHKLVGRP